MPLLVDTGALELLRRRDRRAESLALQHFPPLICTHVAGEFLYGQVHAQVSSPALSAARDFVGRFEMLQPGLATANIYADIRATLVRRGVKLPDPDYWIAAHALELGCDLLSTDTDFRQIPDLQLHLLTLPGT